MDLNKDLKYIYDICQQADSADEHANEELVGHLINKAFQATLALCEKYGLTTIAGQIKETLVSAGGDLAALVVDPESGEPYLMWSWKLRSHLDVLKNLYVEEGELPKTLNLVAQMIRQAEYAMEGIKKNPKDEAELHQFIETMLKSVFPDLVTKPPLIKPIKNFEPDTGIPSLKLLIEYKYLAKKEDAKRVADEILADTAGYKSKDWNYYFFVIYEQHRLKSEIEWTELIKQCGTAKNTWMFVLRGSVPP